MATTFRRNFLSTREIVYTSRSLHLGNNQSMASKSSFRRLVTSTRCICDRSGESARPHSLGADASTSSVPRSQRHASSPARPRIHTSSFSARHFSTGPYVASEAENDTVARPRWESTPRGMSMPFRIRPRRAKQEWTCNSDPRKLGDFYNRLLGQGGAKVLTEETQWLAVTHKSFDQGRRGFNDRLSYLGKRIVDLQTSLALARMPRDPLRPTGPDQYNRNPFTHPLLDGLENLSDMAKSSVISKSRLSALGKDYGLDVVLRWHPRSADNLVGSGQDLVMAQALFAIVGAVALERGGMVAIRVVREKILRPLGVIMPDEQA